MDYDSDSSDFHFPTDTGLPKLSSPLSFKVPESRDWAYEEFIQTLQDKPCTDAENLLSFKQYIPVNDDQEDEDIDSLDFNFSPPKLSLPTFEEKDLLNQLSQHFLALERMELRDILKGGFTLVQNDIQSNNHQQQQQQQLNNKPPGLSWFNEANDYGRPQIESLDSIKEEKKSFRVYENNAMTTVAPPPTTAAVIQDKPLPPLPNNNEVISSQPTIKKKKGLKHKIKSKLFVKAEDDKKKSTNIIKKFIRKILPSTS